MDSYGIIPKKKRFSQHKTNPLNYKISYSLKKNEFSFSQKSNSVSKNKKLRLHTDYADHQYSSYQQKQRNSFSNLKPSTTKKSVIFESSNLKRKSSFSKDQKKSQFKLSNNLGKEFIINSTKNDQRRNNDLKVLFNNPYQSKIKNHKKTKQNNHNYSVFLNVGKQKRTTPTVNTALSPYSQQMNSFLKHNQKHTKSRHLNDSVSRQKKDAHSRDKRQITERQKQNKRTYSKGYCQNTTSKHLQSNSMNKNNIRLKNSINNQEKQGENRISTKLKDSKLNKLFSRQSGNQNINQSHNCDSQALTAKQDQHSTVKTIKKQQPLNLKQSSMRQLQSSRVISEASDVSDDYGLTDQEIQTFGDRFPYGFDKIKLLGRGGFSLVWLGSHIKSGKQFAIKQIISNNTHQTQIKQIWFGSMYFSLGGVPKPQFSTFPGVKNLVRLYSYEINQTDTWIFYQKCGKSLGTSLYDIKSQKIYGKQKLYKIIYKPFYLAMQKNPSILTSIVVQICKSLALLTHCQVVHSDLKTENILIKFDADDRYKLTQLKLIDYGSSFQFRNISQFSMATPQYMPPQILNYIIHQNQGEYEEELYQQVMRNYQNPWAVDIWSLGCVVLQIVVGVPLWMSLPLLVPNKVGKSFLQKEGLFAVKGRLFPQIISKQRQVVSRLSSVLQKQNYSKINLSAKMKSVLKGMLQIDFNKRISPSQIIDILSSQIEMNQN